jgi:hypothetical protein
MPVQGYLAHVEAHPSKDRAVGISWPFGGVYHSPEHIRDKGFLASIVILSS